jgi:hypothetical protein
VMATSSSSDSTSKNRLAHPGAISPKIFLGVFSTDVGARLEHCCAQRRA